MSLIDIQLEASDWTCPPGGVLSGRVVMTSTTGWQVREATLKLGWMAENLKAGFNNDVYRQVLIERGTTQGQRIEVPFRVTIPAMPLSYCGTHVTIRWYLKVVVRPMGGKKSELEHRVEVLPPGFSPLGSKTGPFPDFSPSP